MFSFKTKFEKLRPVVRDLAHLPRTESIERAQVLARWWQKKRDEWNAFIGDSEVDRFL